MEVMGCAKGELREGDGLDGMARHERMGVDMTS